jgi:3-keto-disaccharide hydrolase
MKKNINKTVIALAMLAFIFNCGAVATDTNNTLTKKEKADGWKLLFDGHTTAGWHLYNSKAPLTVWKAKDGVLFCDPADKSGPGDLVTDDEFKNFDLKFEWKIPKEGNSGVFINVLERSDIPTAWASGPEYQLLGNANADFAKPKMRSGCLFGLDAQKTAVKIKAENSWNQSEIKQKDGKIRFYLNGVLTVEEDLNSPILAKKIAASNFKSFPEYNKHTSGHITLQDWLTGISFRNIKIKTL